MRSPSEEPRSWNRPSAGWAPSQFLKRASANSFPSTVAFPPPDAVTVVPSRDVGDEHLGTLLQLGRDRRRNRVELRDQRREPGPAGVLREPLAVGVEHLRLRDRAQEDHPDPLRPVGGDDAGGVARGLREVEPARIDLDDEPLSEPRAVQLQDLAADVDGLREVDARDLRGAGGGGEAQGDERRRRRASS